MALRDYCIFIFTIALGFSSVSGLKEFRFTEAELADGHTRLAR